jgi:hypothetical protein
MKRSIAALAVAFVALHLAGCGASPPRPETSLAGAVTTLYQRVGELEEARADIVRARRRNLEALRQNTERTRAETAILVGAWRLSRHDARIALYEGVLATARRGEGAPAASPQRTPAPSTRRIQTPEPTASPPAPDAPAATDALATSPAVPEAGADRARLATSAQSLALLGARRSPVEQIVAYVRYLQSVRVEIERIEMRARSSAKDAAQGATIMGAAGSSR